MLTIPKILFQLLLAGFLSPSFPLFFIRVDPHSHPRLSPRTFCCTPLVLTLASRLPTLVLLVQEPMKKPSMFAVPSRISPQKVYVHWKTKTWVTWECQRIAGVRESSSLQC